MARADDGDGVAVWLPGETLWSDELAEEILEAVAVSPRSVEWLCDQNPRWPSPRTIRNWKATRPEFRNAFNQARRELADVLAFQAVEIADDDSGDMLEMSRKDGSTYAVVNQAKGNRDKLRAGVRQWLAGKLAPEVYGERLDATLRVGPILSQEDALDQLR